MEDRVVSRKTGLPMTGTVKGVAHPQVIAITMGCLTKEAALNHFKSWTDKYPDWISKAVYTVIFDAPARTSTLEEFLNQNPGSDKEDYEEYCPMRYLAAYPEDDLELLNIEERTETSEVNSLS